MHPSIESWILGAILLLPFMFLLLRQYLKILEKQQRRRETKNKRIE